MSSPPPHSADSMRTGDAAAVPHTGQLVLIVEDEAKLAAVLRDYLQAAGYRTHCEPSGTAAIDTIRTRQPDLVLLDLMLPGRDGIDICRELRTFSHVPVIMVTARIEEIDRLLGLSVEADDYICKPFSPREVVARVRTILRRAGALTSGTDTLDITLDEAAYQARYCGRPLELTPIEFRLLTALIRAPGRVFSRDELLGKLHADDRGVTDRTVDSHIKNLRRKLEQIQPDRELIRSVYGVGYKLDA